ncbi:MAG: SpoIIE family protein phosphatase, partial [Clostridiales Family XIII bacterium]|nr:SpoIIE family protein phosphatase [Clostridiales Family XIII bacterium]
MTKKYDCVFRRMVENLDNPIILLDEGRNIVYANRSAGDMFGDISGKSWEFLFGSGATGAGNAAEALIRGADAGRTEAVLADVTYDMRFSPVSDGEGLNYGVVMLEDVSEKRHLEDRLKRSMEKLKSDTSIAKHIQSSILPIDDEYWNSIKINAIYLPADDLGGDVFDIVRLSEEETLLYIADVSGHGVQASLLTVFLRENVRAKADAAKEGLELLVKELLKNFIALGMDATIYISLLLCRYNKVRGELSIANAGHNCSPLVIRKNGRVEEIPVKGMPISRISK